MASFDDLPFSNRPDLSPYLIHLTKDTMEEDGYTAYDNLINILETGQIWGTSKYVKGPYKAACFMDIPIQSLKYVLTKENTGGSHPRYQPFGVLISKRYGYKQGCRPVLYLSNEEKKNMVIPREELWRVVRFEVKGDDWICWLHEREWRKKDQFNLPKTGLAVLVKNTVYANKLSNTITQNPKRFKSIPRSIIPLSVVCHGLIYMK